MQLCSCFFATVARPVMRNKQLTLLNASTRLNSAHVEQRLSNSTRRRQPDAPRAFVSVTWDDADAA